MPHRKKTFWQSVRQSGLAVVVAVAALAAAMLYLALTVKHDVSLDDATWMLAFLTGVLAFSVPFSIWDATRKQEDAMRSQESANARFYAQEQMRFYAQLDAIYLDIQKLIIQHPFLARPADPRSADQDVQYQAFAFIVWNFIESVVDYGTELTGSDTPSLLMTTWECIIRHEGVLHARWFQDPANEGKFKPTFRRRMTSDLQTWAAITSVSPMNRA
jgi:hypothetical protein